MINNVQTCSKGCLKCDAKSELCLVCDFSNKYFLSQGKCEQKEIENCEEYSFDFKCLKYGLCVQFQGEIENCVVYKNSTECQYCITGQYFDGSQCTPVENEIMNCKYYSSNGVQCEECDNDTFLYIDKQYCIYLDTFEGCGIWSQVSCQNCIDGYYYDQNASIQEYLLNVNQEMISLYIESITYKKQNNFIIKNCQKSKVENCQEFQNYETCIQCKPDYVLVNNICYKAQNNQLQTCALYDDDSKCINCKQGFYLQNDSCQAVDKIRHCINYDSQSNISLCQKCEDVYYLDQNTNTCLKRKLSLDINQCNTQQYNLDRCDTCIEGYHITDDGLKCLPIKENCDVYKPSTVYSTELICQQCKETFYYNSKDKQCIQGTIENCKIYQSLYNECKVCQQGYYLNINKQCIEHSLKNIFECEDLSNTRNNYCESCNSNSIRVTNRNLCRNIINVIENCEVYKTETTCKKCKQGYRTTQSQDSCEIIPIENCEVFLNDTTCLKCFNYQQDELSLPYERSADKTQCLIPSMIEYENCNEIDLNQTKPFCQSCIQNYYPQQLPKNHRVCVPTDFWKITLQRDQAYLNACEIFDYITQQCLKCKDNKVLSQGECVNECPVGEGYFLREISKEFFKNIFMLKRQNFCDAQGVISNCEIYDYSIKSESNYYTGEPFFGCVKCKDGFKSIVDLTDESLHGQSTIYNKDESKSGYSTKYIFISKCIADTDVSTNLLDIDASVDNCDYFIETTDQKYGCIGCSFGFSGLHFERTDHQIYYIKQCSSITGCETNNYYKGFFNPFSQPVLKYSFSKFPLSFYATCHQCTNTNELVMFGLSGGGLHNDNSVSVPLGHISKYSLTTDPPYVGNDAPQTFCAEPATELNIPQDCAVVQVVTDYQKKGYELIDGTFEALYDSAYTCMSCKPGYSPNYQSSGKIISCTQISNCSVPMFNGCYQCSDGYVFEYSQLEEKTLNTSCLLNDTIQDCYSGVIIEDVFYCRKCSKGFILNLDGKCDPIQINNCTEYTYIQSFSLTNSNPRVQEPYEYLMLHDPSGCMKCDEGFVATTLEEDTSKQFCVQNKELVDTGNVVSDSYVAGCLKNYYEPSQKKIRCKECVGNLLLVSGLCVEIQLSEEILSKVGECSIFNYYTRRCDKCKVGYFLNAGVCYKGFIPNCQEFESINKCVKCNEGYVVLTLNIDKAICFKIHENFNCNKWSQEASELSELECQQCNDGYFADYNNFNIPPFLCFEINAVDNCAVHDIRYDIKVSTFNCLQCLPEFYLISNFCIPRNLVDNCKVYHNNEDKCKTCNDGYALTNDNTCEPSLQDGEQSNPCEIYFDQGHCLKCSPGHYIDNGMNNCQEVLKSDKISNCLYYRSSNECESCINGYYLQDEVCTKATARNCLTYQSINKCKECNEGYGYLEDGSDLHCEKIELENCKVHNPDIFYPFQCQVCDQHFYLDDDNVCQPVTKVIQYCEVYQDEFHCEQCEQQKALSESKDGCFSSSFILSKTDEFCYQSLLQSVPKCQLCTFGYFFKDGLCKQCTIRTPQLGCIMFDMYAWFLLKCQRFLYKDI